MRPRSARQHSDENVPLQAANFAVPARIVVWVQTLVLIATPCLALLLFAACWMNPPATTKAALGLAFLAGFIGAAVIVLLGTIAYALLAGVLALFVCAESASRVEIILSTREKA